MDYCLQTEWTKQCDKEFTDPFIEKFGKVFTYIASGMVIKVDHM